MRAYSAAGSGAVGADKTLVTMVSAATIRPAIYDIVIGCAATPGDSATKFVVQRFTAAGTPGSSVTPEPIDPADPAALASSGSGVFSVEPTYTASKILQVISLNQRAAFRWIAAPGFEFKALATAASGIGVKSSTATGQAVHDCNISWIE